MSLRKITTAAMLVAVALMIYIIEAQIPPVFTVPGIKLGLSNVVTLAAMVMLGRKEAGAVLLSRILLAGIFSGQASAFIYSIAGGFCCYIVMCALISALPSRQLWVVSAFGAIAHNIGQLAVATVLVGSTGVLWYAPALIAAGVLAGVFTGLVAQFVVARLGKR